MSPALVAATMAAGDLALMALEVPTGWFADRFGNRRSLILGSLLQVAGMICCWLADGIPGLVGACLLVAVADAFRSGADQRSSIGPASRIDREPEFQRIEARSRAVQVVALALLIVAGGAIVTRWGFAAGWLAETPLCALGGAIAFAMQSRRRARTRPRSRRHRRARRSRGERWRSSSCRWHSWMRPDRQARSCCRRRVTEPVAVTLLVALITLADATGSALATRLPAAGAESSCRGRNWIAARGRRLDDSRSARSGDHRALLRHWCVASAASRSDSADGQRRHSRTRRIGRERLRHGALDDFLLACGGSSHVNGKHARGSLMRTHRVADACDHAELAARSRKSTAAIHPRLPSSRSRCLESAEAL